MKIARSLFVVLLVSLLLVPAFARGSREKAAVAKNQNLTNFSRIEVNSGISVTIRQAKTFSVKASGDQADLDRLEMTVKSETLRIGFKRAAWGLGSVHVDISMPELEVVRMSGGSQVDLDFDATKGGRFSMVLSGGSRLEGTLLASDLAINLSGGSRVAIGGYAMSIAAEVSGGSRFDSLDFAVDKAALELSGGSTIALAVQTQIAVQASGGSRLEYRGNPKVVQELSGAASVEKTK